MNPSSSWEGNQPCKNQGDLCHPSGFLMIFFFNFLQNLQCFPSQTPCSGKQAFVWNSPLGGHGVQRDSGTVEQTLKSLHLDWNSWEVALLLSKSSPSGWLRQGNQSGSCRGCSVVGLELWLPNPAEIFPGQSPAVAAGNPRECFHWVWEGTCAFSPGFHRKSNYKTNP